MFLATFYKLYSQPKYNVILNINVQFSSCDYNIILSLKNPSTNNIFSQRCEK